MNKHTITRPGSSTFLKELENWFEPFQNKYYSEDNVFASNWMPEVDIKNGVDKFIIHADIPGVKAKDIDVNLEKGVLTIKGQRESEKKEEEKDYVHVERSKGSFMRRFSLPDSVDSERIEACCKDGVLELVLYKTQESGLRKIEVSEK